MSYTEMNFDVHFAVNSVVKELRDRRPGLPEIFSHDHRFQKDDAEVGRGLRHRAVT